MKRIKIGLKKLSKYMKQKMKHIKEDHIFRNYCKNNVLFIAFVLSGWCDYSCARGLIPSACGTGSFVRRARKRY